MISVSDAKLFRSKDLATYVQGYELFHGCWYRVKTRGEVSSLGIDLRPGAIFKAPKAVLVLSPGDRVVLLSLVEVKLHNPLTGICGVDLRNAEFYSAGAGI